MMNLRLLRATCAAACTIAVVGCATFPATLHYVAPPAGVQWTEAARQTVSGSHSRICGFIVTPGSPNHSDLAVAMSRAEQSLPANHSLEVLSVQAKLVTYPLISVCSVRVVGFGIETIVTSANPTTDDVEPTGESATIDTPAVEGSGIDWSSQTRVSLEIGDYTERYRRGFGLSVREAAEECDEAILTSCLALGVYLSDRDEPAVRIDASRIRQAACAELSRSSEDELPEACEE